MLVPPIFLIARSPMAPSAPVPVSTTAIARSLQEAATDSNSRSADGRTKWTSSDCESESEPSGFTSRCRLGGAVYTVPGLRWSPSSASLTFKRGPPAEDVGDEAAMTRVEMLDDDDRRARSRRAALRARGSRPEDRPPRQQAPRRRTTGVDERVQRHRRFNAPDVWTSLAYRGERRDRRVSLWSRLEGWLVHRHCRTRQRAPAGPGSDSAVRPSAGPRGSAARVAASASRSAPGIRRTPAGSCVLDRTPWIPEPPWRRRPTRIRPRSATTRRGGTCGAARRPSRCHRREPPPS